MYSDNLEEQAREITSHQALPHKISNYIIVPKDIIEFKLQWITTEQIPAMLVHGLPAHQFLSHVLYIAYRKLFVE